MGRWSQYDEDDYRLPEGMTRVGYDADTQQYTYRDSDGRYFEGAPGSQYGLLRPAGAWDQGPSREEAEADDRAIEEAKRQDWQQFMPFILVVLTFLLVVIYYSGHGLTFVQGTAGQAETGGQCGEQASHAIQAGDTCWAIAEDHDLSVGVLEEANRGLDCDVLQVGEVICIPGQAQG